MSAEREPTNSNEPDASLPIADIEQSDVKAEAAEHVKGGQGQVYKGDIEVFSPSWGLSQTNVKP